MSPKAVEARRNAAKRHGIYALISRGEESLNPEGITRLTELRQLVKSHPGRTQIKEELAARCALIVDLAMAELMKTHEEGQSIWTSPVINRIGTFMAELRRVLDTFPTEGESHDEELIRIRNIIQNDDKEYSD